MTQRKDKNLSQSGTTCKKEDDMQYITEINSYKSEMPSAVTLGKFDALHRGHQKLINKIREYADKDTVSIVCAFDMGRQALLTADEKRTLLCKQTDYLIACPFTKDLREMEAENFIREILAKRFQAAHIVVGTDFRFGHGKRGDTAMLEKYADEYGYSLDVIEKERHEGAVISSTYVRESLAEGNVMLANTLLGYRYRLSGEVQHGKQLGRRLGFPTMNVFPEKKKIMPRFGVYSCRILVEGIWYHGIGNVGVKPTVADTEHPLAEVFVFDYKGDAYGRQVTVEFCDFLRPEKKFDTVEALKRQVENDITKGKLYFGKVQ